MARAPTGGPQLRGGDLSRGGLVSGYSSSMGMAPNQQYQARFNFLGGHMFQQTNAANQDTGAMAGTPLPPVSQGFNKREQPRAPTFALPSTQQSAGDNSRHTSPVHSPYGSQTRVGQLAGSANTSSPGTRSPLVPGGQTRGQVYKQFNGQVNWPDNNQSSGQDNGQTQAPQQQQHGAYKPGHW